MPEAAEAGASVTTNPAIGISTAASEITNRLNLNLVIFLMILSLAFASVARLLT
jgi:hypothetical protein